MARRQSQVKLGLLRIDPYTFLGAVVSFVLVLVNDPWWSVQGAPNNNLLTIQVSPYYLKTLATGIAETVPFAGPLGLATRILLTAGFISLVSASVRPNAWWHDLASYFGMSALTELFLSFALLLHAAETTLLGAYGTTPPLAGTGQLPGSIIGLDLAAHFQPLITAGFGFQMYLGLVCCGLVGLSLVARARRKNTEMKGVEAIFTPKSGDERSQE